MSNSNTLLLTGATGLVGRFLAPALTHKSSGTRLVALVREPGSRGHLEQIRGDITRPDLGLDPAVSQALRREITSIVHCAADINFATPLERSRLVNREGTRHLLQFAAGCRRLEKFAHISTVYVAGNCPGRLLEAASARAAGFPNNYAQSKWEAEEIVLAAARRLPAAIYRLSTIVSDSDAGDVSQFNYVHRLIKFALINPLDAVPGDSSALIDLITADWTAAAFTELFTQHFTSGQVLHLCAGPARSLTVGELFRRTFDFIERNGLARWEPGHRPRILYLADFEAARERYLSTPSKRQFWNSLSLFLPHLSVAQTFDNAKSSALLDGKGPVLPAMPLLFEKVLKTCLLKSYPS